MPAVELDVKLVQAKIKLEELRQDFRRTERAAADTKLAEKMEAGMKKSTLMEFRGMKEAAEKAAAEAAKAAAAKWKEIVTPAVSDPWRMQKSTFNGPLTGGNNAKFQTGQMAQQLQDITVGLQGGISPATILAQQGSQIASIFGSSGAIVGAGIAVGGALMTMGMKGNQAFESLIQKGKDLHDEIEKIAKSGNLDQLLSAFDEVEKQQKAVSDEQRSVQSLGGAFTGGWGMIMGGKSEAEKLNDLKKLEVQAQWDLINAEQVALLISERQLKLNELRAEGKDKEADALERQLKLEAQVEKIRASKMAPEVKKELEANVRESARLEDLKFVKERDAANDKRWEQDADRRVQAVKEYHAAEDAVAEASMNAAQKLVALNEKRLELVAMVAQAEDPDTKLKYATERERVEAQIVTSQMALAKDGEAEAKSRNEKIEAMKKELAGKEKSLAKMETPTATTTYHAPGRLSSQFDWAMGGGSSLVTESTDRNTEAMGELRDEIKALKEKLGPLTVTAIPVFTP